MKKKSNILTMPRTPRGAIGASRGILPPAVEVAQDFAAILFDWVGKAKLQEIVDRNAKEKNRSVCHSHDFCDSNMAMHQAIKSNGVNPALISPRNPEVLDLWNRAWDIAVMNKFWVHKIGTRDERGRKPTAQPVNKSSSARNRR